MNLARLSWSNLTAKPLSTLLSLLLLIMGVGIISLLLLLNQQIQAKFAKNLEGIDMVMGAKGSPLQLILSSVYHIDSPTGNISYKEAKKIAKSPLVKKSIPLAYGDSYKGYRLVGTLPAYVEHYDAQIKEGRLWEHTFEATVGAIAAQALKLKVGDTFYSSHGLSEGMEAHEDHPYKVVGIFENSNSVIDQLLLTNMNSVWSVHDHDAPPPPKSKTPNNNKKHSDNHDDSSVEHDHDLQADIAAYEKAKEAAHDHDHDHDHNHNHDHAHHAHDHDHAHHEETVINEDEKDITAMLLTFRSPMAMMQLPRKVNGQTNMQAALPAIEVNRLFGLMGVGISTLRLIALAIIIISGISIFISLYNSLKDRKYELALMRSMGASRWKLFRMIIQESLLLTFVGFLLGVFFSRIGMMVMSKFMENQYHYQFTELGLLKEEIHLFFIVLFIGFLAALVPAVQAFNTNISKTLAHA